MKNLFVYFIFVYKLMKYFNTADLFLYFIYNFYIFISIAYHSIEDAT